MPASFEYENKDDFWEDQRKLVQLRKRLDEIAAESTILGAEIQVGFNSVLGNEAKVELGKDDRDYSAFLPDWFTGTIDLLDFEDSGLGYLIFHVRDWKTGKTGSRSQIVLLAAMLNIWAPGNRFVGHLEFVKDDGVYTDTWDISQRDMYEAITKTMMSLSAIEAKHATAKPGSHCLDNYCPHMAFCPAYSPDTIISPGQLVKHKYEFTDRPTSPEHAGWMMEQLAAAKRKDDYFRSAMKAYVEAGNVVISPDGKKEWKKTPNGYTWVNR